jgi:Putative polyhydroxyalkanoic acid system protein (PHA_gran_rgn)
VNGGEVRVTISHNKTKEEVMKAVDSSFDQLFQGSDALPVKLVGQQRSWQGSTLTFAMNASMGFMSTPIKGTIEVTDRDITIDADLGILERLIPAKKAEELLTTKMRGLLN